MLIEMDTLKKQEIEDTIAAEFPSLKTEEITKLVKVFQSINNEHDEFRISFNLSIRHLKTIARLVSNGFTIYDSFFVLCKGLGGKEGLTSIKSILDEA
jgi:hypothetical protein